MTKTSTEIFNDKVGLIYEYNKKSPLFVRVANNEIENNNLEHAIEILNLGLKQYPDYTVAHLLLGKALTLIGNYSQALKFIRSGCDLIYSKKTYEYYLREIETIKKQRSMFQTTRRSAFLTEEDLPGPHEPNFFEEEEIPNDNENSDFSVDDRLEQIAREISSAKIPEAQSRPDPVLPANNSGNFSGESMIVSETLAKIYVAQGELKEAIEVYEKLKKKNPKQVEYYNQRITKLKSEFEP